MAILQFFIALNVTCTDIYINLYSLTSGSKERNIQTYKYGEKQQKKKQRASVGYMSLCYTR